MIIARINNYYIGYNLSSSINRTIFVYKKDNSYKPRRGDLIIFKVKENDPFFADKKFTKYVIALPNDNIKFQENSYKINDITTFTAKEFGKKGQKLDHFQLPNKNNIIPKDNYFTASFHPDSYDSRYFGYVHQNQIIGYVVTSI
ncbi:signal peptidase I [Rickettsiales bacterium]|nr:signal peptidase I [Rickettsiales bacterium]